MLLVRANRDECVEEEATGVPLTVVVVVVVTEDVVVMLAVSAGACCT